MILIEDLSTPEYQLLNFPFNGEIIYFHHSNPDRVEFIIGSTIDNICTDKSVSLEYKIVSTSLNPTKPIEVRFRSDWSFSQSGHSLASSVFGHAGMLGSSAILEDFLTVDLKDVFGEREAVIDVHIIFEFDKSSSFEEDKAYLIQHLESFFLIVDGDRYL